MPQSTLSQAERRSIAGLRLSALGIADPSAPNPATVVRRMLAMQAQDFAGAKWAIGLRGAGITEADVEGAIARGEIVRSWPMRGTLHFTPPEDLRWMMRIAADRQAAVAARQRADRGITDAELATAERVAREELAGRTMRRDELLRAFERAGVATDGQRAYALLWNLGHRMVIVFGPPDGKQPAFALLEEWIPTHRDLEGDEALGEFALRYFTGHGPATVRDLAWWASITLTQARTGLAIAAPSLERRELGGVEHWSAPGLEPTRDAVHLLPGFDEYLLGYQDRSAVLRAEWADRIVPGNNGVFQPTIVVNGLVVGRWHRIPSAKRASLAPEWFMGPTAKAAGGVERALRRYAAFLGLPADAG